MVVRLGGTISRESVKSRGPHRPGDGRRSKIEERDVVRVAKRPRQLGHKKIES